MSFGLGFWAAAGAGGAAAGAFEQIATTVLSSISGTVSFTSIPSTYKHLQIRMTDRQTGSNNMVSAAVRFNSDSGSNYAWHRLYGNGSSVASNAGTSQAEFLISGIPSSLATANAWAGSIVDILDYASTSKFKTARTLSGAATSSPEVYLNSGLWQSTNAITQIDINVQSTAHAIGSRFSLYGIRG